MALWTHVHQWATSGVIGFWRYGSGIAALRNDPRHPAGKLYKTK